MARNDRSNYYARYAGKTGTNIAFRSPSAIYESIKGDLGVFLVSEANDQAMLYGLAGRYLPRLSLGLEQTLLNNPLGNQAQGVAQNTVRVFCSTTNIGNAIASLVGKTTRGRRIVKVNIPKRRVFI
ncbi:hypothetical protein C7B65_15180 [Phormidesmis priestleyi ULC007]|uniref:Uncharacterized protein n=1 Tax=Phormidesmis priestleyi ULC007 TaxID=1920490 RepID=A0A2T1DD81_9CYAN|nr:hypothetical protein [Phormidesmis priestleyi]PSB18435.1 hypothetical protein C7B65_15180 [Phormidesmis priestleyi ULC007]PZO48838.1 MAG: hypothetical protein DCF14_16010 [Phormidesmis priestleyi]